MNKHFTITETVDRYFDGELFTHQVEETYYSYDTDFDTLKFFYNSDVNANVKHCSDNEHVWSVVLTDDDGDVLLSTVHER